MLRRTLWTAADQAAMQAGIAFVPQVSPVAEHVFM